MINLDPLHDLFRATFPARIETASIEYVEVKPRGEAGEVAAVFRLVLWSVDKHTGVQSIVDIKQQEVHFAVASLEPATLARLGEYLRALVAVTKKALAIPDIERMVPSDFVDFSALKLVKAKTEADFVAALSVPSRLGRYLSAG